MRALLSRSPRARDLFDIRRDLDDVFNRFLNWRLPEEEQNRAEGFIPAVESTRTANGSSVTFRCLASSPRT